MKKSITALCLVVLMVSIGFVVASSKNQKQEFNFPENPSYTIYHGKGIWSTTHILRKGDLKKPDVDKANPRASTKGPTCYKLMGVSWPNTPDYVSDDLELLNIAGISIGTWDDVTSFDLLGDRSIGSGEWGVLDGQNFYTYYDYPLSGVIAACRTWRDDFGNILEYDILFDTDWTWGDATVNPSVMDLQNIATHEIGHAFGLLDLYQRPCSEVTMFGYSSEGDISGRTLEPQDITGIQLIYGA